MSAFTPTTEHVRDGYRFDPEDEYRDPENAPWRANEAGRAFDRWKAQNDADVRKQVAGEIAEAIRAAYRDGRAWVSTIRDEDAEIALEIGDAR